MDKINNKIGASNHGLERLLERTHCKRGDVLDFLTKIWESGKTIESYNRKSRMFTYLKNVRYNGGNDREVRVHGNTVYIFNKKEYLFQILLFFLKYSFSTVKG